MANHWHPSDEDLILHFYGEAHAADARRIAEHVDQCAACRAAWMELDETLRLVDQARVRDRHRGLVREDLDPGGVVRSERFRDARSDLEHPQQAGVAVHRCRDHGAHPDGARKRVRRRIVAEGEVGEVVAGDHRAPFHDRLA